MYTTLGPGPAAQGPGHITIHQINFNEIKINCIH